MGLPAAARAFDDLSEIYDATRSPPPATTVARLVDELARAGVERLVEVGVGTGRMARPLADAGISVVGVDAAGRMLARARAKGLLRLVRGEAHRLPFADRAFDGALFVHVLHVLDRPEEALREAARVSRVAVFALVQPHRRRPGASSEPASPMRLLADDLAAHGWPRPDRWRPPGVREAEFLAAHPPHGIVTVVDEEVTEPAANRLDFMARGGSRHYRDVPPEVMAAAIARVRAQVGDRTHTYHRVELLARWEARALSPDDVPG